MSLAALRREIDVLDARLVKLLSARARLVAAVADFKRAHNLPVRDPRREAAQLERLERINRGPLSSSELKALFAALIAEFRRFESRRLPAPASSRGPRITIAVVGLGLIGGSLARALKARTRHRVIGVLRKGTRPSAALRACVDELTADPRRVLAADLVVLAVPVEESLRFLKTWGPHAKGGLWTDVGSVKAPVLAAARRHLSRAAAYIGGHPMAGAERSGFAHSRADLFQGAHWALCPGKSGSRDLAMLRGLVQALGGRPVTMGAEEHDRGAAFTSHLPQVAASALAAAVGPRLSSRRVRELAGPGLRDTTRLADSPADLWAEILARNRRNVGAALGAFLSELKKSGDVRGLFKRAHSARNKILRS